MSCISSSSHQLSNGLYVSGRPDPLAKPEKLLASVAAPYTGADLRGSGDFEKMFDIRKQPARSGSGSGSGKLRKTPSSTNSSSSLPVSGPNSLQATGLITSEPITRPDHEDKKHTPNLLKKEVITINVKNPLVSFTRVSRMTAWIVSLAAVIGLVFGAIVTLTAQKMYAVIAIGVFVLLSITAIIWNCIQKTHGFLSFLHSFPDSELRDAMEGQLVKVSGIVTCGPISLESPYRKEARCVYISTELYHRRQWGWASAYSEKQAADFYVSDFQSGLRASVRMGARSKVVPFVKSATAVDVERGGEDKFPAFFKWLADRNLTTSVKTMRLREGYIKEGSCVTVMGIARRQENVLMIVPAGAPISSGFQCFRCLFPACVEGLVLLCEDVQDDGIISV